MLRSEINRQRPVFWLLTFLIVTLSIEIAARLIERAENTAARRKNPFVEAINPAPAFRVEDINGSKYVVRSGNHPLMNPELRPFPLNRPKGGLRIFVLGGSAAAGWPYHVGNTHISALLERKLQMLYPGRPIEVINAAAGTYASHRVKLILDEVLNYNPDLIFIYNGNNEFLESLVYRPQNPPQPWDRSAAIRFTYKSYMSLAVPRPRVDEKNYDISAQVPNTLSFAFSKASVYRENPRQFQTLLAHYRFNIEEMISAAEGAKVPLFFLTCPVNLKDWAPNVSRHRKNLTLEERIRWTELFRKGYLEHEQGNYSAAIEPLRAAIAIDDEYAEVHYLLAQALRHTGNRVEAKTEYTLALQRDANPFRELPEFQKILKEVTARRKAPVVDVIPPLESLTKDGILGLDVLIDYVHLSEGSMEVVAQEMVLALQKQGMLQGITSDAIDRVRISIPSNFWARRDVLAADLNYNMAMIMHQYDRLDSLYEKAIKTFDRAAREDPAIADECRSLINAFIHIHSIVREYRDLLRAEKLGTLEKKYTTEDKQRIFAAYREMIFKSRAQNLSQEEFLKKTPSSPFQQQD